MNKNKKTIIAVILLAVLVAAFVLVWHFFGPNSEANSFDKTISVTVSPNSETNSFDKTISVTVIHGDGSQKDFSIGTNEEFLRDALEQEKLVEGDERGYGLFITSVDGEAADSAAEQWWCICDGDGNMLMTGVDTTPINDGDVYQIILKTGYDEF